MTDRPPIYQRIEETVETLTIRDESGIMTGAMERSRYVVTLVDVSGRVYPIWSTLALPDGTNVVIHHTESTYSSDGTRWRIEGWTRYRTLKQPGSATAHGSIARRSSQADGLTGGKCNV